MVGGTFGTPAVVGAIKTWYRKIGLPTWTPPDRVFAPVWTSLYAMMGVATARVATAVGLSSVPVIHFAAHYLVNLAWAPVFFGLQRLRFAFGMNLLLTLSLFVLVGQYWMVSQTACFLMLPYMAWLLFATYLNAVICRMNPTVGGHNNAMLQAQLCRLQKRASRIVFDS